MYYVPVSEIPISYLPHPKLFCPATDESNIKSIIRLADKDTTVKQRPNADIIEDVKAHEVIEENYFLDIHVYNLNIISKKGNAHIDYINENGKKITDSPKIEIIGNSNLSGSAFINSMDKGRFIKVNVKKSKKVNGRYRSLTIVY